MLQEKPALRVLALFLVVFTLSTTVHVLAGRWWRDSSPLDTTGEAGQVAYSLSKDGTFSNPWPAFPTGPTAHVAPGYPYLLSGVIHIFGLGHTGWWAIHLLTIAAFSLTWALLPWIATVWGLPSRMGLIAAILGSLLPIPGIFFKWEALFVGLLFALLTALTGLLARPQSRIGLWALTGILWGVGLLFSPILLLPLLGWLVLLLLKLGVVTSWRRVVLLFALPILMIVPWTIRNYDKFHHIVFIRDNMGQTLLFSNNDCTTGWVKEDLSSGCLGLRNPYDNIEVARTVAREGEYEFNASYLRQGRLWIEQHPKEFVALTLLRIRLFWFPPLGSEQRLLGKLNFAAIWALTLCSIAGLLVIYRRQPWAALFLISGSVLFSTVYYISQLDIRYRYPILWMTVFGAGAFIDWALLMLAPHSAKGQPIPAVAPH